MASNPAVATNADGRLEVFAVGGLDARLYHAWQICPGCGWTGWTPISNITAYGNPAVEANADGRLEVFVNGTNQVDQGIYHFWQPYWDGARIGLQ